MPFSPSNNPLSYVGLDPYLEPVFIPSERPPTVNDIKNPGTRWQDNSANPHVIWETTGGGIWLEAGGAMATTSSFGTVQLASLAQLEAGNAPSGAIVPLSNDVYTFVNTYASAGGVPATTSAQGIVYLAGNSDVVSPYTLTVAPNEVLTPGNITTMFASPAPIGSTTPGSGAFTTLTASSTLGVTGAATFSSTVQAGNTNITGTLAVSGASTIHALSATTGTFSSTLSTTGNLVLGTAGNKILSTSVASTITAGANSFGTVALVSGTATVSTSAVTSSSIIIFSRQGINGSTGLGEIALGTVVNGTSFVVFSGTPGTPATPLATDTSIVGWMIIN